MHPDELIPSSLDEPPMDPAALRDRVRVRATELRLRRTRRRQVGGGAAVMVAAVLVAVAITGSSSEPTENLRTEEGPSTTVSTTTAEPSLSTTTTEAPGATTSTTGASAPSTTVPSASPTTTAAPSGTTPNQTIIPGPTAPAPTTSTTAPTSGSCGRPAGGAAARGLDIRLDLAANGPASVTGTATITNTGSTDVSVSVPLAIQVDGVDADGFFVTKLAGSVATRIETLAPGQATSAPVSVNQASCGGTKPITGWVATILGLRDGQGFTVTSATFRAD